MAGGFFLRWTVDGPQTGDALRSVGLRTKTGKKTLGYENKRNANGLPSVFPSVCFCVSVADPDPPGVAGSGGSVRSLGAQVVGYRGHP